MKKQSAVLSKKMRKEKLMRIFFILLDFIAVPLLIIYLTHEPNFATGHVDYLEAGNYLPNIDAVLNGKIPYRDFFVLHGPLQLYLQSGFFLLLGSSIYNLFLFFYSTGILTYIILYFLLRLILKTRAITYIVLFIALIETYHPFWISRWGYFRAGFSFVAIFMLIKFVRVFKKRYLFLSGLFCAFSLLYSVDFGIYSSISILAYLIFYSVYYAKNGIVSHLLRNIFIYLFGIFVVLVPFALYLYFNNALNDYIFGSFYVMPFHFLKVWAQNSKFFIHSFSSYDNLTQLLKSQSFKLYVPLYTYILLLAYFIYSFVRSKKVSREQSILMLLALYSALIYKGSFRAAESSQFQLAFLPFLIVVGVILEKTFFQIFSNAKQISLQKNTSMIVAKVIIYSLCATCIIAYFINSDKRFYGDLQGWFYYQGKKSEFVPLYLFPISKEKLNLRYSSEVRVGKMMIISDEADDFEGVSDFIRNNTSNKEIVFSFPEHGIFNFVAARPCLGKFYIAGIAYTFGQWQNQLLHELETQRPVYVIYGRNLSNLAMSIERKEELLPEIASYIKENYSIVKQFKTVDIYKLNGERTGK